MSQTDEKTVSVTDPLSDDEAIAKAENTKEKAVRSRWIEDEEPANEKPKKKGPYIQVPVIISLCLVVVSLVAFFSYKYIFMAEPEGVIWGWHSEDDGIDYYYEFKDDDAFKAYFGSFEVTASYAKFKDDPAEKMMVVSDPAMKMQYIGCFMLGEEIHYSITGVRLGDGQEMEIKYPTDETAENILLKQSGKWECPIELPEDFSEDEALTGEWINVYSSDNAKQTLEFNDDGSMTLAETYTFTDGKYTEIRRYCSYTVEKSADQKSKTDEINITWIGKEPVVHHTEYEIIDGVLCLDGSYFYRADNNPATPDQSQAQ